jgi:alpha-glutamyl/putrescinyl thymine pyrophosphorylase clade 1
MQAELFEWVGHTFRDEALRPLTIGGRNHQITPVFHAYWRFAAERQAIFLRRLNSILPVTEDPILARFKFTNAYRILDRTTQYLVREVIGGCEPTPTELFFRIVLFKLFNKIETWELLQRHFGDIRFSDFRFEFYDDVLTDALAKGRRIYSAAYIMPSGGPNGESKKHRSHLRLLETMMNEDVPQNLRDSESMQVGFSLLRSYPMIGNFLAYQFITDINYSELTNYSEMEFVVPGPGALDGLKKCFPNMLPSEAASLIRFMCENQASFQTELGLDPVTLWGRPLQLIDCQNLFCETDKYARVAYPEIVGFSGRTRIKQSFRMTGPIQNPVLPRKWGIQTYTAPHED